MKKEQKKTKSKHEVKEKICHWCHKLISNCDEHLELFHHKDSKIKEINYYHLKCFQDDLLKRCYEIIGRSQAQQTKQVNELLDRARGLLGMQGVTV